MEAECALMIAKTMILPVGISYAADLANSLSSLSKVEHSALQKMVEATASLVNSLIEAIEHLETSIKSGHADQMLTAMDKTRQFADNLEEIVPDNQWPLPSYGDIFSSNFLIN